jgi:hypothetical protein
LVEELASERPSCPHASLVRPVDGHAGRGGELGEANADPRVQACRQAAVKLETMRSGHPSITGPLRAW